MRRGNAHFPTKIRGQNNDRIHRKYFSPRLLWRSDQGAMNMCRAVETLVDGGTKYGQLKTIHTLMKNLGLTFEQAMKSAEIPESNWPGYKKLLEGMGK